MLKNANIVPSTNAMGEDRRERRVPGCDRRDEATKRERAYDVGDDHHALAVEPVGDEPRREDEERVGEDDRERDQSSLRRRAGHCEHE
jgi:hypothetical protein